jgi:multicomponent Na+:H+ antiporter subunit G
MKEILVSGLLVGGAGFIFFAALGVVRMPDIFLRLSCTSKAATLGIGMLLAALAVHFGKLDVISRALATIGFIILSTPVASHRIGRVAYLDGAPLWKKTIADEMRGKYASGEVAAERKKE